MNATQFSLILSIAVYPVISMGETITLVNGTTETYKELTVESSGVFVSTDAGGKLIPWEQLEPSSLEVKIREQVRLRLQETRVRADDLYAQQQYDDAAKMYALIMRCGRYFTESERRAMVAEHIREKAQGMVVQYGKWGLPVVDRPQRSVVTPIEFWKRQDFKVGAVGTVYLPVVHRILDKTTMFVNIRVKEYRHYDPNGAVDMLVCVEGVSTEGLADNTEIALPVLEVTGTKTFGGKTLFVLSPIVQSPVPSEHMHDAGNAKKSEARSDNKPGESDQSQDGIGNTNFRKWSGYIDMLSTIDVSVDAVRGKWIKTADRLYTQGNIRYQPPVVVQLGFPGNMAEYDIQATVARDNQDTFKLRFPFNGGAGSVTFTPSDIVLQEGLGNGNGEVRSPYVLPTNTKHELLIGVRHNGISVVVDRKLVLEYQGDRHLPRESGHGDMPVPFGLMVYNTPFSLYRLALQSIE